MNLLTVENISKSYGELVLFSDISFGINKDQKIALIAKNGSGKTSILNIMSGKDTSETGQVTTRKGIKISFLEQEPDLNPNLTVEQTIFTTDNEILKVITAYEKAVENPDNTTQYQKAFEAMERLNAWDFETQYKQILFQLQLSDLNAKVSTLSGGQKKRLALANALLNKPDLLILDEPTNHLDLEMIEWLEAYFAKESITLFMVTHDRYFLDRVCNEILELDNNQLYTYKGNYSYYLNEKEARMEREAVEQQKTKMLYKKELEWMRRQPKARTTKSKSRIDDFAEIKQRAHQRRKDHEVQLELNMERLGSKILELHNISKSYGDKTILNKFDYNFTKGERVGIIGKNGTGKSTFLNIITQQESVEGGKVVVGDTVKFGYYTQKGIPDKEGQKVIDVIREFGDYIPLKKGRQISAQQLLERFLFDRKKQYDFVEKLSGGERKRLYLCTVLIQNPNFLILDEPTNDLDIVTLNVLESFLLDFPGCLIVVSHDRYFMDKIVDHLFVFRGEGIIEDFPGNYSDYRVYESSKVIEERENKTTTSEKTENNWRDTSGGKLSYSEQKEYKQLEKDIQKLEEKKEALQHKFTDPDLDGDAIAKLSIELKEVTDAIEEKTERWFELSSILEG
ncbi:MAG: ABC-F family ATP-binding cassette domain-containing protein [Muricauda sp.]|nr:ABC-F family ATP-binding cassette domain-containing protein [Allomuricauda sp.]MBO6588793.1 ABC-F family ATP-binding cassette domain-containing protein [Allomuricauda sp.]MBO6618068.1 ABC-F family ATP-binding cassette domain-containing protein [Allomuricauda sp.]MBO6644331.1 ABC-F family ATP-binding cassette domain-containing protein [Allomuricauda sp.]MBO6747908.1 ABC-F family ATP-binding cassette domain-containing protein [Allomuricauda sp.]MBO6844365.1 ABC-F family ATP-binding cassette d